MHRKMDNILLIGLLFFTTGLAPFSPCAVADQSARPGPFQFAYSSSKELCLILDISGLTLSVMYLKKDGSQATLSFNMPSSSWVHRFESRCGDRYSDEELDQDLCLKMPIGNSTEDPASITLSFTRRSGITGDASLNTIWLSRITVVVIYNKHVFKDAAKPSEEHVSMAHGGLKSFPLNRSYECPLETSVTLDKYANVTLVGYRMQAFMANNRLDPAVSCSAASQRSVWTIIGPIFATLVIIGIIGATIYFKRRDVNCHFLRQGAYRLFRNEVV